MEIEQDNHQSMTGFVLMNLIN